MEELEVQQPETFLLVLETKSDLKECRVSVATNGTKHMEIWRRTNGRILNKN